MAEGLSAVATKAFPRAVASASWFGIRKPSACRLEGYKITRLPAESTMKRVTHIARAGVRTVSRFNLFMSFIVFCVLTLPELLRPVCRELPLTVSNQDGAAYLLLSLLGQ